MSTLKALAEFGLEEKEQAVYLALLELGEASVRDIATKTGLKRPTVYVVLSALEEKQCVRKVPTDKMLHYAPTGPQELAGIMRERLLQVEKAVPDLQALLAVQRGAPSVHLLEGNKGIEQIGDELFHTGEDIMYLATLGLSLPLFEEAYIQAGEMKLSSNLRFWELIDDSEESRDYARKVRSPFRHVRFIAPDDLPFPADIAMSADKVYITSVRGRLFSVRIESKDIATAFRAMFRMLWRGAKE